jgi:hypothetical protein
MATSYMKFPLKCLNKGYYEIAGSFQCNAALGPLLPKGAGFVATRTGLGVYLLTLSEAIIEFISGNATLQLNAAAAQYAQLGDVTVATPSVVIRIPGGVDVAAHAQNRVNFSLVVRYL